MALYDSASTVIDARSDVIEGISPGVQRRPAKYLDAYPRWIKMRLPCTTEQWIGVVGSLKDQINKPYDQVGIWDFATCSLKDRNWREHSAWFCDELDAYVLEKWKVLQRIDLPMYRLTPGAVALMCQQVAGAQIIASRGLSRVHHQKVA